MMKSTLLFAVCLLGLVSCQNHKIGFVDNSILINDYQEKKDIEAKLQQKITAFQTRTDSLRQAFQLEINEAELKSKSMSPENVQKLSTELRQKEQSLSQRVQFEQQQLAQESRTKNDSLISKVKDFVNRYGKDNGYTFILGSNEGGSVMYGEESNDLTQELLEALNAAYKK